MLRIPPRLLETMSEDDLYELFFYNLPLDTYNNGMGVLWFNPNLLSKCYESIPKKAFNVLFKVVENNDNVNLIQGISITPNSIAFLYHKGLLMGLIESFFNSSALKNERNILHFPFIQIFYTFVENTISHLRGVKHTNPTFDYTDVAVSGDYTPSPEAEVIIQYLQTKFRAKVQEWTELWDLNDKGLRENLKKQLYDFKKNANFHLIHDPKLIVFAPVYKYSSKINYDFLEKQFEELEFGIVIKKVAPFKHLEGDNRQYVCMLVHEKQAENLELIQNKFEEAVNNMTYTANGIVQLFTVNSNNTHTQFVTLNNQLSNDDLMVAIYEGGDKMKVEAYLLSVNSVAYIGEFKYNNVYDINLVNAAIEKRKQLTYVDSFSAKKIIKNLMHDKKPSDLLSEFNRHYYPIITAKKAK